MPKVTTKSGKVIHFPYTEKGKEAAKKATKKYHALKGASKWRYDMTGGRML